MISIFWGCFQQEKNGQPPTSCMRGLKRWGKEAGAEGGGGERSRGNWHGAEDWAPHSGTAAFSLGKPLPTPEPAAADHTPMLEQLLNYLVIVIVTSIN